LVADEGNKMNEPEAIKLCEDVMSLATQAAGRKLYQVLKYVAEEGDAERTELRAALNALLASPAGCVFCDFGKLRTPTKDHDDDCGFAMASKLVAHSK